MSFPAESTQWLHCALRIKSKLLTMNHRAYTALPKSSGTCGFPWTLTQGLEMPEPAAEKNMMVTFLEFSSSYDCSHHSLIGVLARSLHQFLNPGTGAHSLTMTMMRHLMPGPESGPSVCCRNELSTFSQACVSPAEHGCDKHTTMPLDSPLRFITLNFRWALHAAPDYSPLPESRPSSHTSRKLFHTCYSPSRILPPSRRPCFPLPGES